MLFFGSGDMVEPHVIIIASIAAFFCSWFGSLVGGGGLIVVPLLLSLGLPIPVALGTRRFSSLGGTATGLIEFHRYKKINYKLSFSLVIFALMGSFLGYVLVESLNESILRKIIGFLIVTLAIVLWFENQERIKKLKGRLYKYRNVIGPPVAISSSLIAIVIGGAGGTVLTYLLIIVYGQTILQSAGNRRLPLLAGNILAVILFILAGYVHYALAVPMLVATAFGGYFGSRFYLKRGDEKVRVFFFGIMILLGMKILFL